MTAETKPTDAMTDAVTLGDDDDCDHDDYESDVLTGRAVCNMCGHRWTLTAREIERQQERQTAFDVEEAYWNRVDEGRQRAKDGER